MLDDELELIDDELELIIEELDELDELITEELDELEPAKFTKLIFPVIRTVWSFGPTTIACT